MKQESLIKQKKVPGLSTECESDNFAVDVRYLVECVMPDEADVFECYLPRKEVRKDLLEDFETVTLPKTTDHKNLKTAFKWVKGPRQKRRMAVHLAGKCHPAKSGLAAAKKTGARTAGAKTHNAKVRPVGKPAASGWLGEGARLEVMGGECGIDKEGETKRRRRSTGGVLTATLPCGMLLDWVGIPRAESLTLVYMFLLQLSKDLSELNVVVRAVGYDNGCKLLAFAERLQVSYAPWTEKMAAEIAYILDRFHRRNHTWCLENRPSVDPANPDNAKFVEGKNTEACE